MSQLANLFGGAGGGGGGMPDLAGLMSNPAIASMAQNLMASGGLEQLMSNPALANMVRPRHCAIARSSLTGAAQANRFQQGGGMPPMDEIMSDPNMRNLCAVLLPSGTCMLIVRLQSAAVHGRCRWRRRRRWRARS